jgi:hypothetical protein
MEKRQCCGSRLLCGVSAGSPWSICGLKSELRRRGPCGKRPVRRRGPCGNDDQRQIALLVEPSRRQLCIVLLHSLSLDPVLRCRCRVWPVVWWFLWLLAYVVVSMSSVEVDGEVGFVCSRRSDDDDACVLPRGCACPRQCVKHRCCVPIQPAVLYRF